MNLLTFVAIGRISLGFYPEALVPAHTDVESSESEQSEEFFFFKEADPEQTL